jgi:hypothetical protein
MTVHQAGQDISQIGVGVGPGEFAALDEADEDRPVMGALFETGEERIIAVQGMERMARSTGLVSSSTRPSSRNQVRPSQRERL